MERGIRSLGQGVNAFVKVIKKTGSETFLQETRIWLENLTRLTTSIESALREETDRIPKLLEELSNLGAVIRKQSAGTDD